MLQKYSTEENEYPFAPYLFRPNQEQFTKNTGVGNVLLHERHIMGQNVTTTYRLHEIYIYVYKMDT